MKLEPFLEALPHPLADEILHREALTDLEELLGVSEEQQPEFDRQLKLALERFIRNYRIVQSTPRLQKETTQLLKQICRAADKFRDLLNRLDDGDGFVRRPKSSHLKESLVLDLIHSYGRRSSGDDWWSRIDGDLSMLLTICRFALQTMPHGNRNFVFDAFILDLAGIYHKFSDKPPRTQQSTEPTEGFCKLVDNVFFALRAWGEDYYDGSTYTGLDSLRTRIRRSFGNDDSLRQADAEHVVIRGPGQNRR